MVGVAPSSAGETRAWIPSQSGTTSRCQTGDEPLRGELLGADRLAAAARELADRQTCTTLPSAREDVRSATLVDVAESELAGVYRILAADVRDDTPVSPSRRVASRQLLPDRRADHVSFETICPQTTVPSCPGWRAVPYAAYSRASSRRPSRSWSHTDSRVDREGLELFIMAYQDVSPLIDRRGLGRADHAPHRPHREPAAAGAPGT